MTRGLGFDGDDAYYTELEAKVRADEAAQKASAQSEASERRRSLGLPEKDHMTRKDKKLEKQALDPEGKRKKSIGEKVMNLVFNGGRPDKRQMKQEDEIGLPDGELRSRRQLEGEEQAKN